jgi:hypothetical protein
MKPLNWKIYRKNIFLKNFIPQIIYYRKVILMEDEDQNMHLKNLSIHAAQNEEEALNLLFLGDTNRMIAEVTLKIRFSDQLLSVFLDTNESSINTFSLYIYHSCNEQRNWFSNCA